MMRTNPMVTVIIPVFNRPDELAALLVDIRQLHVDGLEIKVLVVDNSSTPPVIAHDGIRVIRLSSNTGGSGGFNAGLRAALAEDTDFLWLLDSDVGLYERSLVELVNHACSHPDLAGVGSVLVNPSNGKVYEAGGRIDRRWGHYLPVDPNSELDVPDYAAACSLLVRAEAVRSSGLMPQIFLNCDDILWCLALARVAGPIAIERESKVTHPPGLFPGRGRYYQARNGFGPIDALRLGWRVRFRRALLECGRTTGLALMGRRDLAELHICGLRDAARVMMTGQGDPPVPKHEIMPLDELGGDVAAVAGASDAVLIESSETVASPTRRALADALSRVSHNERCWHMPQSRPVGGLWRNAILAMIRVLSGVRPPYAVVIARDAPEVWAPARNTWYVAADGYWMHVSRRRDLIVGLRVFARALRHALRIAVRGPAIPPCEMIETETAPDMRAELER